MKKTKCDIKGHNNGHIGHTLMWHDRIIKKVLETIMLYGIANICWLQGEHMVIRVGLKEYSIDHQ